MIFVSRKRLGSSRRAFCSSAPCDAVQAAMPASHNVRSAVIRFPICREPPLLEINYHARVARREQGDQFAEIRFVAHEQNIFWPGPQVVQLHEAMSWDFRRALVRRENFNFRLSNLATISAVCFARRYGLERIRSKESPSVSMALAICRNRCFPWRLAVVPRPS